VVAIGAANVGRMTVPAPAHASIAPTRWPAGAEGAGPSARAGLLPPVGAGFWPAVGLGLWPWIEGIDLVAGTGRHTLVQAPDVASTLVFRTDPAGRTDLIVAGPRTRGTYHPAARASTCIRMRVRSGRTRALLGAPVNELADRATPIEDLWGGLGRRLAAAASAVPPEHGGAGVPPDGGHPNDERATELFRSLAEVLRERARSLPSDPAGARLVGAAMRELAPESGPAPRLGVVADRLGISERHLRTVFAREVGLSPKHFARIARLRRVLALAGRREWARVAGEAGFFDQAHLITDFRALMGISPGAYLAGRLPAPAPCSGAR
jgi:AraC-like DNA-binding protein